MCPAVESRDVGTVDTAQWKRHWKAVPHPLVEAPPPNKGASGSGRLKAPLGPTGPRPGGLRATVSGARSRQTLENMQRAGSEALNVMRSCPSDAGCVNED